MCLCETNLRAVFVGVQLTSGIQALLRIPCVSARHTSALASRSESFSRSTPAVTNTRTAARIKLVGRATRAGTHTFAEIPIKDIVLGAGNVARALALARTRIVNLISRTGLMGRAYTGARVKAEILRWTALLDPGTLALAGGRVEPLQVRALLRLTADAATRLRVKLLVRWALPYRTHALASFWVKILWWGTL